MDAFKFELGQQVKLSLPAENGTVVGRAEYPASEADYLVRYTTASGEQVQKWWPHSALAAI